MFFNNLHMTLCRPQSTPNMAQHGCGSLTNQRGQGGLLKEVMLKPKTEGESELAK